MFLHILFLFCCFFCKLFVVVEYIKKEISARAVLSNSKIVENREAREVFFFLKINSFWERTLLPRILRLFLSFDADLRLANKYLILIAYSNVSFSSPINIKQQHTCFLLCRPHLIIIKFSYFNV